MSAAIRTIKLPEGDATYDSDMPMGSLRGLLGASQSSDIAGVMEAMTSIVVSWPYGGEPSEVKDWDSLKRRQFNQLVTAVVEDLGKLGEA